LVSEAFPALFAYEADDDGVVEPLLNNTPRTDQPVNPVCSKLSAPKVGQENDEKKSQRFALYFS
jgi:hypothetical protein